MRTSTFAASLGAVRAPTLVLHARGDEVAPVEEGRLLATGIPGAEFVELDSRNHVLLEHEPAWQRFQDAVLSFLKQPAAAGGRFGVRGVVGARARGPEADDRRPEQRRHRRASCQISDKTVRNHASNVFDKLGVWSRAQAIVFARDHGFNR